MGAMNDKSDQNSDNSIENASEIIERFGGIRPMANKMNVPVTTVQGWKKRDVIPANRRDEVIEAAAENDIDVSDLVAGAANENAAQSGGHSDDTYELKQDAIAEEAESKAAAKEQNSENEAAVLAAKRRAAAAVEPPTGNEELIGQIRKAQSMAVTRSVWFSVALVAGVVGISAVLLWPTKQQIAQNGQNIALLQGEMQEVKKGQGLLRGLIPDDIEARFSEMQAQTRDIQDRVSQLSTQAQSVARDVMDPNASVGEKLERLGTHAQELGAPSQLSGLLTKIREMEQSAQGQAQLSSAVAQLNALLTSSAQAGEEGDVETALQQAQQQDDALGQTLEGVSPQDLKAATLLLGLSQLRSSLNRSAPFEEDLALMEKTLGTDDPELQAAIARLAPKAKSGVLTTEGLKGEFKGLAGDIVVASLKGEDVSVQEKARARLNNLIQVEKDGELITGTDTQATVARAQKQLEAGDVQAAIAILQSLEGEAASTAQPFINEAEMTLVAEQLQGLLTQKVVKRIGGGDLSAVNSGGMGQLLNEIKKMAPQRTVVREEESGFIMLEPKPKYAP